MSLRDYDKPARAYRDEFDSWHVTWKPFLDACGVAPIRRPGGTQRLVAITSRASAGIRRVEIALQDLAGIRLLDHVTDPRVIELCRMMLGTSEPDPERTQLLYAELVLLYSKNRREI